MAELYVRESQTGEFCNFIYLLEIETAYHSVMTAQGHHKVTHNYDFRAAMCAISPSLSIDVDSMISLLVQATKSYLTAELTAPQGCDCPTQ